MSNFESVPLAAIHYQRRFDIDQLLIDSCAELRSLGLLIGGVIQKNSIGNPDQCADSIHVIDLRSNATFNIWENRGPCSRSCRLDERGLIDAEPGIMAAIDDRVDLLVINRFGRAESLGRGLIGCFSAAMEAGIPILTAVRAPYVEAWNSFHAGMGEDLEPNSRAVVDWCRAGIIRPAADTPVEFSKSLNQSAEASPGR